MMWFLDQGQPKLDEIEISDRCVAHEVGQADAAIITIGRQAGEGMDRQIEGEFNLTSREKDMISRVSDHFHQAGKPVVVIINSGSVMETCSWRDRVDAILVAWQPGMEGGNSVADVLTGKVNPSGHLTMTWPVAATDHPSTSNFPQGYDMYTYNEMLGWGSPIKGRDFTNHEEDIYVGYRYFDTFSKPVAYPFGYGLSYTTFQYSAPRVKVGRDVVTVSITVRNTGAVSGKEVVQVYVTAPKGQIEKPAQELRAFAKTRSLKPGEQQQLTMQIPVRELASFDEAGSQWLTESGLYTFRIGASSRDIRQTVKAKIDQYTEKVSNALALRQPLNLLHQ
jgi:beta-glucosidase